jgi:hypothetical protein
MNEDLLEQAIAHWEQPALTIVRTIDSEEDTVERILQRGSLYWLYRYFQHPVSNGIGIQVSCSVDLDCVDAERVIQHLAERL